MQILPVDPTGSGLNFLSGMSGSSGADASSDFVQAMQNAMDSVENGQHVSVNAALQDDSGQNRPAAIPRMASPIPWMKSVSPSRNCRNYANSLLRPVHPRKA